MPGLWRSDDKKLPELAAIGASDSVVATKVFKITPEGAQFMRVEVDASSVTASAGIAAKLQHEVGAAWEDVSSVAVSADGTFVVLVNARDTGSGYFSKLPLSNKGRVLITTGAGDAVTVDAVRVIMED